MSGKSSKKFGKIILWVLASFLAIDILLVGLLFVPAIQTYAVGRITGSLTEKWGTEISIKDIRLTPTLRIIAHELHIKDHHSNDMIYVGTVKGRILSFSRKPTKLKFKKVILSDADVTLRRYTGEESVNISLWARKFKKKEKKSGFLLSARCLELKESRFVLILDDKRKVFNTLDHPDIDYAFLELKDLDWDIDNFVVTTTGVTTIAAKFKHLAFQQYGGFQLKDGHGDFSICDTALIFDNCFLSTPDSKLELDLRFLYNNWHDFSHFTDSIRIKAELGPSFLCMQDVAAWAPSLRGMQETFFVMADRVAGPVNDFKIIGLQAGWNMTNRINGDIALRNVTHFKDAYITLNLSPSVVNVPELALFTLPNGSTLPINKTIARLGTTKLKGTFTGTPTFFDAQIDAQTDLGKLFANLATMNDQGRLRLEGSVASPDLNLASLTGKHDILGYSDVFVSVDGTTAGPSLDFKSLHANISGDVKHIDLLGYRLRNATIDGEYRNKLYNCTVHTDDPLFGCDVLAQLDLSDELPALQGNITLQHLDAGAIAQSMKPVDTANAKGMDKLVARLQRNPSLRLSFDNFMIALRGNNLENINGYAGCDNILIFNNDETTTNDRLRITAINTGSTHKYILSSGLANASLETNYPVKSIKDSLQNVAHNLFPSLIQASTHSSGQESDLGNGYLKAHITTYRTRSITKLIIPDLFIAPNSVVDINISSDNLSDNISANIPFIGLRNKIYARNIILDGHNDGNKKSMQVAVSADSASIRLKSTPFAFSSIHLNANTNQDSIRYALNCRNSSNQNKNSMSQISGTADISNAEDIVFRLKNSVVYLNDSDWWFNDDNAIHIRKKALDVHNLRFFNEDGQILVSGTYSKNPDDKLTCQLTGVDLSMFNSYMKSMDFGGDLSANITIRTRNGKTILLGKALANDFIFNDAKIGNLFVVAGLDTLGGIQFGGGIFEKENFSSSKELNRYTFVDFNEEKHPLARLSGQYKTDTKKLTVNTSFDTLNAGFVAKFVSGFSDQFTGTASGTLAFHSSPDSTYFEGIVKALDVDMGIAPLGTVYHVHNQDIIFNSEGIFFQQMLLHDKDGNPATMNGAIRHNFFRDMNLDLHINTDRLLAINTPKTPTAVFYGDGYVSGDVDIFGPSDDITFRGPSLRTLTGSRIVLQVTSSNSTSQSNTIYFKPKESETASNNEIRTTQHSSTKLNFDFTFDVTNDADVVIYLESIGGTMNARADGRFQLLYNDNDGLNLFGRLGIYSGEFKIALFNVVNSRFTLVPGGSINFDGPLNNMDVRVSAYKSSKTSLSSIVPNDNLSGNSANVNAYLHLNGLIMQKIEPTFSFELPNSNEEVRNSFYTAIDTTNTENMTRQFAYFMVTNNFMPNEMFSTDRNNSTPGMNFFSNVVNNLIGNMIDSKKGHFGITFNQATETSSAEYGVNASANILKDRVSIETSIGYYDDANARSAANMYGDFTVEYSLNPSGTWKLKAYTFIGERDEYYVLHNDQLNYTAGVALAYKQDFGNVRRKNRASHKNRKKNKDEKH